MHMHKICLIGASKRNQLPGLSKILSGTRQNTQERTELHGTLPHFERLILGEVTNVSLKAEPNILYIICVGVFW